MTELKNSNPELIDEDPLEEEYEKNTFQYDPEKINIVTRELTIEQILRRIDAKSLDLAANSQARGDIWKDEVKSRLIESILIRIPLPVFYIDATNEDKWLVVDGVQRLFTLKQFVNDKTLKLIGLEYLTELEGKTYDELERRYQRRIEESQVLVYLIEKGTPPEFKFNIFKRINTGGMPLTSQDLRNALNSGQATQFLAKLAKSPEFCHVINLSDSRKKRMDDQEFILGFLAFTLTSYKDYKTEGRDVFLTKALSKANNMSEEELNKIEDDFKKAMVAAHDIFGNNAFRKISTKGLRYYPLSKTLFEVWSVNLNKLSNDEIQKLKDRKQLLIDKYITCIDNDKEFMVSISQAYHKVQYRFFTIEKIIKEVLA